MAQFASLVKTLLRSVVPPTNGRSEASNSLAERRCYTTAEHFASLLGNKLLCRVVPSSPVPADALQISLSFRNTQWFSVLAVEDANDKVWYVFKNGSQVSLGWVPIKYAVKDFLRPKVDVLCEVRETDDWFHTLVGLNLKQLPRESFHCLNAATCLVGLHQLRSQRCRLGWLPRDLVKTITLLVLQTRAARIWHLCDV